MKKKAFTLIELIAVLVILAILALIVTPLVMNIIKKARESADKRSIDAYGRSIELAIATYLLDNEDFPTDISQLTIEYSGDEGECSTTQLNTDSSVYLAGCSVAGRSVDYTYGSDKSPTYTVYNVGDQVTYNNVDYYVIKESGAKESTVTMLKAEPLTVDEVNQYGAGHVNRYTDTSHGTAAGSDAGYGGMAYYTSETCGLLYNEYIYTGCTNEYDLSEIKYVVDAWAQAKASGASETRLMTYDEFVDNSEIGHACTGSCYDVSVAKYDWMYNNEYWYWLSTPDTDSQLTVWSMYRNGMLNTNGVASYSGSVRPVITISKTAL